MGALNSKDRRIRLTHCISELSISFLDLFLYRGGSSSVVMQFSTFQKPQNKYLYIPFESFHPSSNKKAFIKGELMRYARNSSSFKSFSETRERFWQRLRLRGYSVAFLLPLFFEIRYSDHRRTGQGGEGGCNPPKFWATQIFWTARENLGKASF